jgi:Tfp pilus assembly protein PilF
MNLRIHEAPRAQALFVFMVAAAVYINSAWNGFALDDTFIVEMNSRVHDLTDLRSIWLTPYWTFYGPELGLWRPLTIFLFAVQWAIGDGAPWVFHTVNIGLHAVASVLVFVLLRRFAPGIPALVGALLFAVHPVHTEAVANVVGQAELVGAVAVFAACLIHSGRGSGLAVSWPRRLALIALFLVGLTTKESTVVLPGLLVIVDFAQRRVRPTLRGLADYADAMLMPILLLSVTLAAYLLVRFDVMGGTLAGVDAAPALPYLREEYRVLNALRAFPEFLRLLFFPLDLASDYSPAMILPVEAVRPMVVLGALLLVIVTFLALLTPWLPALGFAPAWFLLGILTVSNLFFPVGVLVAERTLYLPSFALSALAAFAWHAAAPRASQPMRRLAPLLLVGILIAGAARTWIRNPDWDSTPAVWEALYRDSPESYRAQWVQASLSAAAGNLQLAREHYELAYRIYPRDGHFLADYGSFLMRGGNYRVGVPMMERADRESTFSREVPLVLGFGYVATGRYREALEAFQRAESRGAPPFSTMPLRANAYRGLGDYDRAIGAWRVAIRHASAPNWRLWGYLARDLAYMGDHDAAAAAFDSARIVAAGDSAGLATTERAHAALEAGCFELPDDGSTGLEEGFAAAGTPECDPLGHWIHFVPPAQIANPLQNATSYPPEPAQSVPPPGH